MDKRTAYRFPTELDADCRSSDQSWKSRLRNISTGDCMIECPDSELPKGSPLRLRLKGLPAIDGEIAWQHRGHAGVRFRQELRPALLEDLAFRTSDWSFGSTPPQPFPESAARPRPSAPSLHGQLVKRSLASAELATARVAQAS